jgi:hypothetical protein
LKRQNIPKFFAKYKNISQKDNIWDISDSEPKDGMLAAMMTIFTQVA